MKNNVKKLLCAALSTAMVAGSIILPMTASAETTPIFDGDTVEQEWKFDFGAAGTDAEDGYTLVTRTQIMLLIRSMVFSVLTWTHTSLETVWTASVTKKDRL